MENMNIAEMSRDELVRLVAEKSDTLDLDVLKQWRINPETWGK